MLTNKKTSIRLLALALALMMAVAVFAGCSSADEEARAKAEAAESAAQAAADEAKKTADSLAKVAQDLADKLAAAEKAAEDAKNAADEAKKDAAAAKDSVSHFHDGVTTPAPVETAKPIEQAEFTGITETVKENYLKQFTEMKNKYLITRADWYTVANYSALAKVLEDASYELYRLTTVEGVEQLLAETETKANAVPSIVNEAAKVQALIAAFGDVPATLFTTNKDKVEAARAAFDKWVNDYSIRFFVKNGFTFVTDAKGNNDISATGERKIVDFARKLTDNAVYINVNENTNSLLYAEAKIAALLSYASDAIRGEMIAQLMINGGKTEAQAEAIVDVLFDENATSVEMNNALDQYKVVKALVDKTAPTYSECKANAALIEECYEIYRIFYNANGGDDTPISYTDSKGNVLLTGEQFVKLYVLCLYDGELTEYENMAFEKINNEIVPIFMNVGNTSAVKAIKFTVGVKAPAYDSNDYMTINGVDNTRYMTFAVEENGIVVYDQTSAEVVTIVADGIKIERALNRVVANANAKVLALDYSTDFKGKKSLTDAYVEIDQIIIKAIIEMTQVYYDNVVAPFVQKTTDANVDIFREIYANTNGTAPTGYSYTAKTTHSRYPSAAYYKADNDFFLQAEAILTAAGKALAAVDFKSYEDLNKIEDKKNNIKNISDQKLFDVTNDAQGCIDSIALHTTGNDSALNTILAYAIKSMDKNILDYAKTMYKVTLAMDVHETAIMYAQKIDDLVGIAKENDATKGWDKDSKLITDFGASYSKVVGPSNYKVNDVYQNLVAARDAARADILAVKLLNDDGSFAIDKETYAAKDAKGKAVYTKKADYAATLSDKSADGAALQVVVDPEIVAENIMISKFAAGADAVILKFCDATRATIKSSLTADLTFYGQKYFGDLDHVKLEADMKAYIEYLTSLTDFAGVGSNFKTSTFSKKGQAVSSLAGYTVVTKGTSSNYSHVAHVAAMVEDVADITGLTSSTKATAWYNLTKGNLETYFGIKNGTVVSEGLKLVKQLSYKKDILMSADSTVTVELDTNTYEPIEVIYKKYTGTVKDGAFTVAPVPAYALGTQRTALYLSELAKVKAKVIDKVAAVNLLDSGVKAGKTPAEAYAAALKSLDATMAQTTVTTSDSKAAANSKDDYSFYIAWARFYTDDPTQAYDWTAYKG